MPFQMRISHIGDSILCREKPNYCNLILWGQKDRSCVANNLEKEIAKIAAILDASPPATLAQLEVDPICCVRLDHTWCRAKPVSCSLDERGWLELNCIDIGKKHVTDLSSVRLLPVDSLYLRNFSPLASKFLLADVVVKDSPKEKEPTIRYLKCLLENRMVKAVTLGVHDGLEGIRVYLEDNLLLARVLVERNLGVAAASYHDALEITPPGLHELSVSPNGTKTVDNLRSGSIRSVASISRSLHYRASVLASDVERVIVTAVHKGPFKFTVQAKSPETEAGLDRIREQLEKVDLEPLEQPARGVPCIVISDADKALYRGLIVDEPPTGNSFSVYFVDYGFTEPYNPKKTFRIPADLVTHELYSIRVSLAEANELSNIPGATETFTKLVLKKTLGCKVVGESPPQQLILFDEKTGRSIKDTIVIKESIVAKQKAAEQQTLAPPTLSRPTRCPSPAILSRAHLEIPAADINEEEELFVTWVGSPGRFFGQFMSRNVKDLEDLENELRSFYGNEETQLPRLFSCTRTGESYEGYYGVFKWSEDGNFYRVKIIEELSPEVVICLVDYGNELTVTRPEVWAPIKGLTLFTQTPFGMGCVVADVELTADAWYELLADRRVIVRPVGPSCSSKWAYEVVFPNCPGNASVLEALTKPEVPMLPETPALVPTSFQNGEVKVKTMETLPEVAHEQEDSMTADHSIVIGKGNRYPLVEHSVVGEEADAANSVLSSTPFTQQPSLAGFGGVQKRKLPIEEPYSLSYLSQRTDLVGSTQKLEVVFAVNPGSFYCQLADAIPQLDSLMGQLASTYSDSGEDPILSLTVGMPCVAQYLEDGGWYRGLVIGINDGMADIFFCDYGNRQRSSKSSLRAMREEFLRLPPQAYHCELKDVRKVGDWTAEEIACFESATSGKPLLASFKSCDIVGKLTVRLVEKKPDGTMVDINELFGALPRVNVQVPSGTYSSIPIAPLATQEVSVAWTESLDKFFLAPKDLSSYKNDLDELEEFYSTLEAGELVEDCPKVGLPCVVRFVEDGLFYRSRITAMNNQSATVIFVDYGNEQADTPLSDLKRIIPRFLQFPQLVWRCKLNGVKSAPSTTPEQQECIAACLEPDTTLTASFHSPDKDGVFLVDLVHPKIGNVTKYLLDHKVIEPLNPEVVLGPQRTDFAPNEVISRSAVVPFVKSTSEFWIQLDPEAVEAFMERIDTLALQPEFIADRTLKPCAGKACLAFFDEDERYYRAILKNVGPDTATATYVDYGNGSTVRATDLRPLPVELSQQPPYALQCTLDGVDPASKTAALEEAFAKIVLDTAVTVECIKVVNGILHVRLYHPDGTDVLQKISTPTLTPPAASVGARSIDEPSSNVPSRVQSTSPEMEFFDSAEVVQVDTKCHPVVEPMGVQFHPGQVLSTKAMALCITSSMDVWIQLDPSAADALTDRVNRYVAQPEFLRLPALDQPRVGDRCLALFPDDHSWYRAVIESIDGNGSTVRYIDFGNCSPIGLDALRPLPAELDDHGSGFALRFALDGANRYPGASVEACRSAIFNEILTVTVSSQTPEHTFVRLHGADGVDINRKLGLQLEGTAESRPLSIPPVPIKGEDVVVSYVESPSVFWIQPQADKDALVQIENNLNLMEKTPAGLADVKAGDVCAVLHPTLRKWFRASLLHVEGDCVQAHFVDRGDTEWVSKATDVLPCPKILRFVPPMAAKCTFRHPVHPDHYSEDIRKAFVDCTDDVVCQAVLGPKTDSVQEIEALYTPTGINVVSYLTGLTSPRSDNSGGSDNISTTGRSHQQRGL